MIFNRQPSLHKMSMMGHRAKVHGVTKMGKKTKVQGDLFRSLRIGRTLQWKGGENLKSRGVLVLKISTFEGPMILRVGYLWLSFVTFPSLPVIPAGGLVF